MRSCEEHLNEQWLNNNTKLFFRPVIPFVTNYFASVNKFSGNLLDIGCGWGEKANALTKIGFQVTGIDYDTCKIAAAKQSYPAVNFEFYHIKNQLPFGDNSFDVIFSNSVFQYIEHESIIGECKRILKPDGCIILIENLKDNPISKSGRVFRKIIGHDYRSLPFNHFSYKEINVLKNEFNNVALNYFHFLTPFAQLKIFKKLYPAFHQADRLILQYPVLQRYSWISSFAGLNNK